MVIYHCFFPIIIVFIIMTIHFMIDIISLLYFVLIDISFAVIYLVHYPVLFISINNLVFIIIATMRIILFYIINVTVTINIVIFEFV